MVQSGDHFPSGDYSRFNLGIISGPGIICGLVQFSEEAQGSIDYDQTCFHIA